MRDSGLLHALLGVTDQRRLSGHPKLGASWEGFVLEEILRLTGEREAWFWGTQGLSELDLLVRHRGQLLGFEMKHADAPGMTKSLHVAMQDLGLDRAFVVYPGTQSYRIASKVEALGLRALRERLRASGRW